MPPFTQSFALSRNILRSKAVVTSSTSSSNSVASTPLLPTFLQNTNNIHTQLIAHSTCNNTMNISNLRYFSSSIKKDKYGRLIQRRVVAIRTRNQNHGSRIEGEEGLMSNAGAAMNKRIKKKKKNKCRMLNKSKWPKMPKILTPTNVPLQQIQPPPRMNTVVPSSTSFVAMNSGSSSSTSLAGNAIMNSTKAVDTSTSATAATITNGISKEKKVLSGIVAQSNNQKQHRKFSSWFRDNLGTIILNIGSICTLTAFTRTDMLELRLLSMTGSISTIYYFMTRPKHQIVYGPIVWGTIFLSTNALMTYYVIEEREGKTRQFTSDEEDVYEEHFLPYGVTPRQYEKLLSIAQRVELKRGEVIIKRDDSFDAVYLVTSGSTSAMTSLSRRVTAASSVKGNREKLEGGDAGAWIGELAFLEKLGSNTVNKSSSNSASSTIGDDVGLSSSSTSTALQKKFSKPWSKVTEVVNITVANYNSMTRSDDENENDIENDSRTSATSSISSNNDSSVKNKTIATAPSRKETKRNEKEEKSHQSSPLQPIIHEQALLTYIANQDSVLYKWDFEELADLLNSSVELRLAVTRAMTAAVVHKVVNLYLSKSDKSANNGDKTLWKNIMQDVNEKTDQVVNEGRRTDPKMQRLGTVRINMVEERKDS